jgi:hypothetical protein
VVNHERIAMISRCDRRIRASPPRLWTTFRTLITVSWSLLCMWSTGRFAVEGGSGDLQVGGGVFSFPCTGHSPTPCHRTKRSVRSNPPAPQRCGTPAHRMTHIALLR